MIVDCAVYSGGRRRSGDAGPAEALAAAGRLRGGFVWLGIHDPDPAEFDRVVADFGLHPLAVEDALHAHQRPKLERYGDTLFVVLKTARYVDPREVVDIGQVVLFVGPRFVVTVRHGAACGLTPVRARLEAAPELLRHGPSAVLHAVMDQVVDDYADVLRGVENDIDEIEQAVFSTVRRNHAERIFKLKREVLDFRRAVAPLADPLDLLQSGGIPGIEADIRPYFRDVNDHVVRVREQIEAFETLLTSALAANLAQVGVRQNEDMRKISAWVAILAVPTMIAGIYGMNFEHMPELETELGYPAVLAVMLVACGWLYRTFKRNDWL
jgi:magnesium transporter